MNVVHRLHSSRRYPDKTPVRSRIWPVLLLGYSILLLLIAFSGFSALQRATGSYAETTDLYSKELRTVQTLERLRSDVLSSAIALRDILLLPADQAGDKREELHKLRISSQANLRTLQTLIPRDYRERLQAMTRAVDEYWQLLPDGSPDSRLSGRYLRNEILPRRQEVLLLAGQIEELTRDSIHKQREEIQQRQTELPVYIAEIAGATFLVGLVVAAVSMWRISHLETLAADQHRVVVDAEEELRRLSQQMVTTQEEERRSLSRELHDQIGQVLTALRIGVGNLEEALREGRPDKIQTQLDQSKRLSEQALRSVRDIAMGLRPAMLDDLGLEAALEWQARQFSRLCNVPAAITVEGELEACTDDQQTCIYRVVQEALNNIAKHAGASQVDLVVSGREAGIRLEIRDNGDGFDPSSRRKGLGLTGIKERVRQLGGETTIHSRPAQGTSLMIWLPFTTTLERV